MSLVMTIWFKTFIVANVLAAASAFAAVAGVDLKSGAPQVVNPGPKGTVLIFMSAKCPCSNSHVGVIRKIAEDFKDFAFVAVHSNSDEDREFAKSYFENAKLSFPVIQDSGAKLANEYKALRTPHAFLLNPQGQVLFKGGVTDCTDNPEDSKKQYLRQALDDVQHERKVKLAETRPLGCAITRE